MVMKPPIFGYRFQKAQSTTGTLALQLSVAPVIYMNRSDFRYDYQVLTDGQTDVIFCFADDRKRQHKRSTLAAH